MELARLSKPVPYKLISPPPTTVPISGDIVSSPALDNVTCKSSEWSNLKFRPSIERDALYLIGATTACDGKAVSIVDFKGKGKSKLGLFVKKLKNGT
tara:strand:- start:159 stop:449 length:291 start_codon:yes stop_codon:yes gene_type:complete